MKGLIFLLILSFIGIGSIICTAWLPAVPAQKMPAFAGSEACKSCHHDIFNDTRHTAHYLSSALPDDAHIKGTFAPGKNEFVYNQWMVLVLDKKKMFSCRRLI
ncbi:hypothetical protein [Chitinophaga pinensis]|uniref:Cytochrome c-552/4 domain-containing protein n=1 Tax=Chitinophaga pinensis TaxID=79329 RepID=A0A5C6LU01_9BACT|nr:hypothetical protein [Chitinophaga pinensis]TWW00038.1 hypothetical protein FEF09_13655 [Chitinophaga pinensis]